MIRASVQLPRSCADHASETTQTSATSGGSDSSSTSTPRPTTRPRTASVVRPRACQTYVIPAIGMEWPPARIDSDVTCTASSR